MAGQEQVLKSLRDAIAGQGLGSDDVLDLTQKVNADGSITVLTPNFGNANDAPKASEPEAASSASVDVLSEIDSALSEFKPQKVTEKVEVELAQKAPEPITEPATGENMADSLISDNAANAAKSSLDELMKSFEQQPAPAPTAAAPSIAIGGGKNLEQIVVETITPILKSWLDANLASTIERLVQAEIKALIRSKQ